MFSKKPAGDPLPAMANKGGSSTFSVIGTDVTIRGDITASADLHIDGRIEGDLICASLVQGETSHIEGAIEAETARIAGTVIGSIKARELIVLRSATIHGDVQYDVLTIEQGAQVDGRFAHGAADAAAAKPTSETHNSNEPLLTVAG